MYHKSWNFEQIKYTNRVIYKKFKPKKVENLSSRPEYLKCYNFDGRSFMFIQLLLLMNTHSWLPIYLQVYIIQLVFINQATFLAFYRTKLF